MVQSVKPPEKARHSARSKKTTVIEHEPLSTKTQDGEPHVMGNQEKPMSDTENTSKTLPSDEKIAQNPDTAAPKKTDNQPDADSKSGMGSIMSGVTGGIIVCVLGAGLQWGGVLPSFHSDSAQTAKLAALGAEVEQLKKTIGDNGLQGLSTDDRKSLTDAVNLANQAQLQSLDATRALAANAQELEALKTSWNSIATKNGDPEALNSLTQKFIGLDDQLKAFSTAAKDANAAYILAQKNADTVQDLTTRVEKIEVEKSQPMQGKEIALLMAANALKNAVDRGGSYANELKTLKTIAPNTASYSSLDQSAATGVPNQAMLSASFAQVADNIAATENDVASDAGMMDKLWSNTKGLFVSRPIGNVEGTNAGAIAARMEVAIQAGDYQRAMAEWQELPQKAKDVSKSFVQKLEERSAADALIDQLVTSMMQPNTLDEM